MLIDSTVPRVAIDRGVERDGNVFEIFRKTRDVTRTGIVVLGTALAVVSPSRVIAQDSEFLPLNGPAELVRSLRLPGLADEIRRPLSLHVDRRHGEIFATDSGSNRILVFDQNGYYRYQFDCADWIGTPLGVVVDSEGFVFVLGTVRSGQRLVKFDFDGMPLGDVDLSALAGRRAMELQIDDDDRLVVLDDRTRVHLLERDGTLLRTLDIGAVVPSDERNELILGKPLVRDELLYLPASTLGNVLVIDMETGEHVKTLGVRGNTPGQLNFPVAVDLTSEGIVAVLDKMRFAVVCYSADDGRFLGEFGGKGFRDGWFYHPNLLAVSDDDHLVVGQMLDGRIQLCRIPRYVMTRHVQVRTTDRDDDEDVSQGPRFGADGSGTTLDTP